MSEQEIKVNKVYREVRAEKFIENTLEKIKEIVKDNKDKDCSKYVFFVSEKAWDGIAELWGVDLEEDIIYILAWRGFNIYKHKATPHIYFSKVYLPNETPSGEILKEVGERLEG